MANETPTVTQEYMEGIREGRALFNAMTPEERAELMPRYLSNCEATMRMFSVGPVKDMLRGERDFWRNQIRKAAK